MSRAIRVKSRAQVTVSFANAGLCVCLYFRSGFDFIKITISDRAFFFSEKHDFDDTPLKTGFKVCALKLPFLYTEDDEFGKKSEAV